MISVIIIGKNEEKNIKSCIKSVENAFSFYNKIKFEIIFVDSNSTDNSISVVNDNFNHKIIKLISKSNAAIARNIGVQEASGDILLFVDGDMELTKDCLSYIFDDNLNLKHKYITGQLYDIIYNMNGVKIDEKLHDKHYRNYDEFTSESGGLFFIKKDLWNEIGGMNNKFKRSQDMDFSLRLAKKGIKQLRINKIIAKHHTVPLDAKQRMWKMLFNGSYCYSSALLYRAHIFNPHIYKRILRIDSTLILLFLFILLSVISGIYLFVSFYFLSVIARVWFQKIRKPKEFCLKVIYLYIRDFLTLFAFLFFFPKRIPNNKIQYTIL